MATKRPKVQATPATRIAAFETAVNRAVSRGASLLTRIDDYSDAVQEAIGEAFNGLLATSKALRAARKPAKAT